MAIMETAVEQTRRMIIEALDSDKQYNFSGIGVDVLEDLVILTGTVETAAEKLTAENHVRSVPGVRAVTNELMIRGGVEPLVLEDRDIHTRLASALEEDPRIGNATVEILVEDAVAVLSGSVRTHEEREAAAQRCFATARNTVIVNRLAVVPTADKHDRNIAARVLKDLDEVRDLDLDLITVAVEDRVVILTGRVPGWNVLFAAENSARKVDDVKEVRNELIIGIY